MMRDLVISKLKQFVADSQGYGIPRYFDCDDGEFITDADELETMTDEQLLEVFETAVGFGG
jgi:hypothetical protein